MLKYEEACKVAYDYYAARGKNGLCEVNDLGDAWLFAGGDPKKPEVGGYSITINKDTGNIEPFFLPDKANFKRLDKAIPLVVPDEYSFKK